MTPRTTRTPAQRAQEAVEVLERRLAKTRAKAIDLGNQSDVLTAECQRIERRLDYAKASPDLATPPKAPDAA